MLNIWKEREIFAIDIIEDIDRTIHCDKEALFREPKKASPCGPPPTELLKFQHIPSSIKSLYDAINYEKEWKEQIDLNQDSLNSIMHEEIDCTEMEVICKQAEFERAIEQRKSYAAKTYKQSMSLLISEDNKHLQEVIQIEKMQNMIAMIEKIRKERGNIPNHGPKEGENTLPGP